MVAACCERKTSGLYGLGTTINGIDFLNTVSTSENIPAMLSGGGVFRGWWGFY